MRHVLSFLIISITSACIISCISNPSDDFSDFLDKQIFKESVELKYSEKFSIRKYENFTLLEIKSFSGDRISQRYFLSKDEKLIKSLKEKYNWKNVTIIQTPVKSLVSLSSQNIAFLDALSLIDRIKGIDLKRNIANSKIHSMLDNKKIFELGEGRDIDLEMLSMIAPDLVLLSGTGGEYDAGEFLGRYKAVSTYEWLEKTPLARSEWIKCIALFFGKLDEAEIVFSSIEQNYIKLILLAASSDTIITVLPNMIYSGSWAVPGGKSFAAALFKDANIIYPWRTNDSEGSFFLDFESVLSEASDADVWLINSSDISSIDEIIRADMRYKLFNALKTGRVYNNNVNTGRYGNPYWEEGILYPDRVLSDLIKIFHPEAENTNPFYFYKKLAGK